MPFPDAQPHGRTDPAATRIKTSERHVWPQGLTESPATNGATCKPTRTTWCRVLLTDTPSSTAAASRKSESQANSPPRPTRCFLLAYIIGALGAGRRPSKWQLGCFGSSQPTPPQRCSSTCHRQLDLPTLSRLLEGRKDRLLFASTRSCVSLESSGRFGHRSGHADFEEPPQRCLVKLQGGMSAAIGLVV